MNSSKGKNNVRTLLFIKSKKILGISSDCRNYIFSLLAVNVKVINLIKTDKIRESEKTIGTVSRSIDHYLLVLQQSASELMLNNQNMVLRSTDDKRDFTSSATYRYSEMIHNIKVANSLVDDIYLYYPKLDYVVGTEGSYRSKNIFSSAINYPKADMRIGCKMYWIPNSPVSF